MAARGYSLALGFLCLAIYLLARTLIRLAKPTQWEILNHARAVSVCVALSFCANFSFAYANAFLLLAAFFTWLFPRRNCGTIACSRLALACAFPAFVVIYVLVGSVLSTFLRDQLFWGGHSIAKSWNEIHQASFEQAPFNEYLVNPSLGNFLRSLQAHIVGSAITLAVVYFVLLLWTRPLRSFQAKSRLLLAGCLTAVLVLTLATHWLQFKFLKIPLPLERTSLFLVPLSMAIVGAVFSVAPSNVMERAVRGLGTVILCIASVFFIGTLRDSFFRMWRSGADVKAAFPVILKLCRKVGVREVASDQNIAASLNFYKLLYRADDLSEFPNLDNMPSGKAIYVLFQQQYADFIRTEGLQVAYHGPTSDLVVAIRPAQSTRVMFLRNNAPPLRAKR